MSTSDVIAVLVSLPFYVVIGAALWRYRKVIDRAISTGANRWLVARHRPENIGEQSDPELWCFTCRKQWPCTEWTKLHEERAEQIG